MTVNPKEVKGVNKGERESVKFKNDGSELLDLVAME
jgi:hypothetical protein